MIKTRKLTPSIYTDRSRDFQLLANILDAINNYALTNVQTIRNFADVDEIDERFLDHLCIKLGFKKSHEYNTAQLRGVCSIFLTAVRNKGTLKSIQMVLDVLANVAGLEDSILAELDYDDPYMLVVHMPPEIKQKTLFNDILDYLLPAGMTVKIIVEKIIVNTATTHINGPVSTAKSEYINSYKISKVAKFKEDGTLDEDDISKLDHGNPTSSAADDSMVLQYQDGAWN